MEQSVQSHGLKKYDPIACEWVPHPSWYSFQVSYQQGSCDHFNNFPNHMTLLWTHEHAPCVLHHLLFVLQWEERKHASCDRDRQSRRSWTVVPQLKPLTYKFWWHTVCAKTQSAWTTYPQTSKVVRTNVLYVHGQKLQTISGEQITPLMKGQTWLTATSEDMLHFYKILCNAFQCWYFPNKINKQKKWWVWIPNCWAICHLLLCKSEN